MEYADGGDLLGKIKSHTKQRTQFSEEELWTLAHHLAQALKRLHEMNVLHRDLKVTGRQCANVFLGKDGSCKIGDLNVSKVSQRGLAYTQTGTPYYASPEVWKDQPYDSKCDIWSLGCVLYEAAGLTPPFKGNSMTELYTRVTRGAYAPLPSSFSAEFHEFIRNLLQVEPSQRPSCEEILRYPAIARMLHSRERSSYDDNMDLLGTIQLPKNIKLLNSKFPAPNYEPRQTEYSRTEPISSMHRAVAVDKPPMHSTPKHVKPNLSGAGKAMMSRHPSKEALAKPVRVSKPPLKRKSNVEITGQAIISGGQDHDRYLPLPLKLPVSPVLSRDPSHKSLSNRIASIRSQYEYGEAPRSRNQIRLPSVTPSHNMRPSFQRWE